MKKSALAQITHQWALCLVLALLVGCRASGDLRVVTDDLLNEGIPLTATTTISPAEPDPSTPTPQIVGNFTVAPYIVSTLPAPDSTVEPAILPPTAPSPDGEDTLTPLSIEALATRPYGQDAGTLKIESTLESTGGFARALITYPSDGLTIYGFINIPPGTGPFPVVIFIHGYVEKPKYKTLDYSTRYADDLARQGYIVIHPNLRGYPPSDDGPDLFEIGKAIDVLNLVAIIQRDAGKTGLLLQADPNAIAVWGHSTGGGIALRVATINLPSATGPGPAVKAAILYAPMSGDEAKNAYHTYYTFSGQTRWKFEITVPAEDLVPISPVNHYNRIEAAVQIHHGRQDHLVPPAWSEETCALMEEAGVNVECFFYRTQTHNFCCDSYRWMLERLMAIFP